MRTSKRCGALPPRRWNVPVSRAASSRRCALGRQVLQAVDEQHAAIGFLEHSGLAVGVRAEQRFLGVVIRNGAGDQAHERPVDRAR